MLCVALIGALCGVAIIEPQESARRKAGSWGWVVLAFAITTFMLNL